MKVAGNTVLITGGATGIGFALARKLIDADNTVIICGRSERALAAAAAAKPGLVAVRCDVTLASDREAMVQMVAARFPAINMLVNNAGSLHVSDLRHEEHVKDLTAEVAVNLIAPVALTSLLLPLLMRQAKATVVNVTTGYVFLASARTAPYCATKAALHTMTLALRFQLRETAVKVVEVMPPAVDTALAAHYSGGKMSPEKTAEAIMSGLDRELDEIAIGVSKLARVLGRIAPKTAFRIMNAMEEKSAVATPPGP